MSDTSHPQGIKNEVELVNTRAKLARLETLYEKLSANTTEDRHVRELTLRSLNGTIDQFKGEIARYVARQPDAQMTVNS